MNRDGSSRLAAAVIKAALEDRKDYIEKFKLNPENGEVLTELEDLEEFFKSELFVMYCNLCDMNPDFIRKYLKDSCSCYKQGKRKNNIRRRTA